MAGYSNPFGFSSMSNPLTPNPYGMVPVQQQVTYTNPNPSVPMTTIQGRLINNESEIPPDSEIPMDGNLRIFPMKDYSCIYVKGWNANMAIQTMKFVPEQSIEAPPMIEARVSDETGTKLLDQIDSLNSRFDDLERLIKRNSYNKKNYNNYNNKNYRPNDRRNQNGSKKKDGE